MEFEEEQFIFQKGVSKKEIPDETIHTFLFCCWGCPTTRVAHISLNPPRMQS